MLSSHPRGWMRHTWAGGGDEDDEVEGTGGAQDGVVPQSQPLGGGLDEPLAGGLQRRGTIRHVPRRPGGHLSPPGWALLKHAILNVTLVKRAQILTHLPSTQGLAQRASSSWGRKEKNAQQEVVFQMGKVMITFCFGHP